MIEREWRARDPQKAFFPVELRPVYMGHSGAKDKYRQLPNHVAVVDVKKNYPFAVVTNNYKLITNEEAYNQASIIMEHIFQNTKIDDMACLNIIMPRSRSFCHIDLIHESSNFLFEKDKWTAFLRITNSYNRTRLLRYNLGFCRWICLNGMIFGQKSIEFSYVHTHQQMGKIKRFAESIGDIRQLENQLIEKFHHLKRYYIPESEMLAILCRVFDIKATNDDLNKPNQLKRLQDFYSHATKTIKSYFSDMGPHGYAALNVISDYASYPKGVIAPESRVNSLQQKCGKWIDEFVNAIQDKNFSFDNYLADYRETVNVLERF
jgi:hypothetical protein